MQSSSSKEVKKEFKVGQKWKTRAGDIKVISHINSSSCYPVTDTDDYTWNYDGAYFYDEEYYLDLVELIEDVASEDKQSTNKYTVEEVINALRDIIGDSYSLYISDIEQHLSKTKDPEYQKYLELKAKFE